MIREDYIIRLIKQLAAAVARIAGHRKREEYEQAHAAIERAWEELFDIPRALVDRLDGPTLASLLNDAAKLRVAAQLLVEEGKTHAARQDPVHALICKKRAFELFLEARAIDPQDEDDAAILELARSIPPNEIDPRYRAPA